MRLLIGVDREPSAMAKPEPIPAAHIHPIRSRLLGARELTIRGFPNCGESQEALVSGETPW